METKRNDNVVNNAEDVAALEQFVRDYREGKVSGVVLTYQLADGKPQHKVMGAYAEDLVEASNQVRRLDLALNRLFLRPAS